MAYSLYLTHKEMYGIVRRAAGPTLDGRPMLAFAVYALAALAGGSALYWAVERPFLKLRDRLPRATVRVAAA